MVRVVVDAPPEAAILLHADESRMHLLPLIRASWHWVGQQVRIPTPGADVSRALFGVLEIRASEWIYLVRERMRREGFCLSGTSAGRLSQCPDHLVCRQLW